MLHLRRKKTLKKLSKSINYQNLRDHCHYTYKYRGAAHSICNLEYNVLNEISVVFHDCCSYDYRFILKKLANRFEKNLEGFWENTKKCQNVSI